MSEYERQVANRLKTARGHLNGVIQMVADGAYCPEVMKQLAAVQGLLEGTSRMVLRRHLETCVARAMQAGETEAIVDELMETLKFDKHVLRPAPQGDPVTLTETIAVPEIHCDHCQHSIEGALRPLEGVEQADVDIAGKQVTVTYDAEMVSRDHLVQAIEEQGYEVPA